MASHPAFDYSHLTIEERLLVEDLWDSIPADADADVLPLAEAERVLLDERVADLRATPAAGRPWTEVRREILSKRR